MTATEKAMQAIRDEADRSGDEILNLWAVDLGDGTVNVKAIVRLAKTGKCITVGNALEEVET